MLYLGSFLKKFEDGTQVKVLTRRGNIVYAGHSNAYKYDEYYSNCSIDKISQGAEHIIIVLNQ